MNRTLFKLSINYKLLHKYRYLINLLHFTLNCDSKYMNEQNKNGYKT